MRLPSALRGPSQIMSMASASAALRQLAAGAPGTPQMLALALKVHARGIVGNIHFKGRVFQRLTRDEAAKQFAFPVRQSKYVSQLFAIQ